MLSGNALKWFVLIYHWRRQWQSHSSTLAWKILWMKEPGRLQSIGLRTVGHNWETSLSLFTFMNWRRKWQPTPVFLPGESQGRWSLVGCCPWGRTVGYDWSDLAAAAAWPSDHWRMIRILLLYLLKIRTLFSGYFCPEIPMILTFQIDFKRYPLP